MKHQLAKAAVYVLTLLVPAALVLTFIIIKNREAGLKREVLKNWKEGSYAEAFEKSSAALEKKPLDSFLLTVNGFVSYQLAVSQITTADTLLYLDACVWSLRKALLKKGADRDGRVRYVLGKAYYEKGQDYADLAARYLEEARAAGCDAGDLGEYLGLAYESVRDYRKSVEVLLQAVEGEAPADRLLVAVARSYAGLEDWGNAAMYLNRCIRQTKDSGEALRARLMLGRVLRSSGDAAGAEAVYNEVLETAENAEASHELGEIYAAQGDIIRARAAWRRAYRADSGYRPARARLNI